MASWLYNRYVTHHWVIRIYRLFTFLLFPWHFKISLPVFLRTLWIARIAVGTLDFHYDDSVSMITWNAVGVRRRRSRIFFFFSFFFNNVWFFFLGVWKWIPSTQYAESEIILKMWVPVPIERAHTSLIITFSPILRGRKVYLARYHNLPRNCDWLKVFLSQPGHPALTHTSTLPIEFSFPISTLFFSYFSHYLALPCHNNKMKDKLYQLHRGRKV